MITYALLILATLCHLVFDLHKKGTSTIRHWLSATIVIVFSFISGLINQWFAPYWWWQFLIYSLAIHFCFFDYLWNFFNHQRWNYHGDPLNPKRAWTDKMWDFTSGQPWVEIGIRLWVLAVGYGIYYHWAWVVSYQGE